MPDLKSILNHVLEAEKQAHFHERLQDIYSGNLLSYVEDAINAELSPGSARIATKRIAVVNLLERIVNKLSKVYADVPNRRTADAGDQEIINAYIDESDVQAAMAKAELLLNLNKQFALEPYVNENGYFSIRVLGAHEFTVFSDDEQNPSSPTALIKFMGKKAKGKKGQVSIYWVYDAETFTILDSDGEVLEQTPNPYGVLPFIYCSSESFKLQPKPDHDAFANCILIPKLLTDLNYAAQFQSHSIMYGIDVDTTSLVTGPDLFWNVKSTEGENSKPQIGTIQPSVDVDKVLSLITFTVSEWLTSKGIRPGSVGSLQPANAASGVSKIVDEADTSQLVNKNRILLTKAEKNLWWLLGLMHNTLLPSGLLAIDKGLSDNLNVSVAFPVQQPIADPAERRNELKFQLENKLISYSRALKQAHPDLSDDEIAKLKAEIEAENKAAVIEPAENDKPEESQTNEK